jgi:ElaB/YqjD/DUF883 family membrane-anchored ribosome-binding protein
MRAAQEAKSSTAPAADAGVIEERVAKLQGALTKFRGRLAEHLERRAIAADQYVRDHAWKLLGIAAIFVLGMLVRGRDCARPAAIAQAGRDGSLPQPFAHRAARPRRSSRVSASSPSRHRARVDESRRGPVLPERRRCHDASSAASRGIHRDQRGRRSSECKGWSPRARRRRAARSSESSRSIICCPCGPQISCTWRG